MVSDAFNRGPGITRKSDTRITRVGRALRKLKIDETPQFINVLKGEMTIVGPRPEDPRYVDYNNPLHDKVLKVLPGITSPASIVYRNEEWLLNGEDWESYYLEKILPCKLAIDIEYLKNRSFKGDLILLFKTFMAMFK
jgi:lipopolysaccharide/colanic/teichoic acid biosynthesis glycosyltransferase